MNTTRERVEWVDIVKGIGIIAVVIGHVTSSPALRDWIYLFHMPLFFVMSGYLYKPASTSTLFRKKALQLFVPYISFMLLLSAPEYLRYAMKYASNPMSVSFQDIVLTTYTKIYGGSLLSGWFGAFWFAPCLFFTQQIYNIVIGKMRDNRQYVVLFIVCAYSFSMINSLFFSDIDFPLAINVVASALVFYWIGNMLQGWIISKPLVMLAILVIAVTMVLNFTTEIPLNINMKHSRYGIPVFSVIVALSYIVLIVGLARVILPIDPLKLILMEIGRAALIIVFTHQVIQKSMANNLSDNDLLRILAGITIPYILYKAFACTAITRKIFLGDFHPLQDANKAHHLHSRGVASQ